MYSFSSELSPALTLAGQWTSFAQGADCPVRQSCTSKVHCRAPWLVSTNELQFFGQRWLESALGGACASHQGASCTPVVSLAGTSAQGLHIGQDRGSHHPVRGASVVVAAFGRGQPGESVQLDDDIFFTRAPGGAGLERSKSGGSNGPNKSGGKKKSSASPEPPRTPVAKADVPVGKQSPRVQASKKGRGGKTVTVITGLQHTELSLQALMKKLKGFCGAGGTVKEGEIEIQGDHAEKLTAELQRLGYSAKRSGGK